MFQPQPTPYLSSFIPYGLHVENAGIPNYSFEPTPLLSQFGGGHVGGNAAGSAHSDAGVVGANARAFHASANANANTNAASSSPGPAGMGIGVGIQGLGASTPVAPSDNSAGYSSGSANGIHPGLFTLLMPGHSPASVPRHRPNQHQRQHQQLQLQHRQPRHQNQPQQLPHLHQHQHQALRPQIPSRNIPQYKMDPQRELDQNEIAQQEAAARDYTPQFKGPLIGEKVSSRAIAEEYARADPTYVAKTMALPQTYSHYRPIQGDGNCGYRAIAFAYFEILVQCGDLRLVQSELQRMTVLNKYIEDVGGQDPGMLELMVSDTIDLFNDIIPVMSEGNDPMPLLLDRFNDPNASQCLVYHLRLLAGARLKGHRDQYEPYLDTDVETYLATTVMPVNREIDHICVALVHAILLKPVNIVLNIAYLDRSEGTEVNVHQFPEETNGQDLSTLGPVIYLLYRPGHYDILYRETQVHIPLAPVDLQVNRVTSFVHHNEDFQNQVPALQNTDFNTNMGILAMIPGLDSGLATPFCPPSTTSSPMTDPFTPSPAPSWISPQVVPAPSPSQPSPPQQRATEHPLRFSKYSYNLPSFPDMAVGSSNNTFNEPSFTTNTFKNSHFNTAHYNNQNFQPEMYQPDAEEEAQSSGNSKNGGRKRSNENCPGIKKEK
ncbi:peptidase C65 Otubain-domain-containing protein [Xylaria digitata]|nr:peptidase C65 Otubain-domain-containing protein [Xylaria digitata]